MVKRQEHTAIVITDTAIVGMVGFYEEGMLIIDDAFTLKRTKDLKHDCFSFIKRFSLEDCKLSAVKVEEVLTNVMEAPHLSPVQLKHMLMYQISDDLDIDLNRHVIDYMVKSYKGKTYLIMAAINREDVYEMTTGLVEAYGDLRIVDYWPSPALQTFGKPHIAVLGEEQGETVRLDLWIESMKIYSLDCPKDGLIDGIKELLREAGEEDTHIEGVQIYKSDGAYGTDYDYAYEYYGRLEPVEHIVQKRARDSKYKDTIIWDNLMGLLVRSLKKRYS